MENYEISPSLVINLLTSLVETYHFVEFFMQKGFILFQFYIFYVIMQIYLRMKSGGSQPAIKFICKSFLKKWVGSLSF